PLPRTLSGLVAGRTRPSPSGSPGGPSWRLWRARCARRAHCARARQLARRDASNGASGRTGGAMRADATAAGSTAAGTDGLVRPATVEEVVAAGAAVLEAVGRVVVGQADALRLTLAAVLAGGHV